MNRGRGRDQGVFGGYPLCLVLALCWHHVLDRIGADVRSSGESSFRCYLLVRESEHDVCQAGCGLSRAEGLATFERLSEQQQDEQSGSKGTRQDWRAASLG